jgi:ABC-type molybdate transport system substrate-binding protein
MQNSQWPVIPPERGDDLHNLDMAGNADLVLFMAGNQFMAMPDIVTAFQEDHPEVEKIFYETLPPGLELNQIMAGGAIFRGEELRVFPDIYTSVSENAMDRLAEAGRIDAGRHKLYLHNRLSLMVPAGNPAGITTVADLGRKDVRISQPDPENEHIAFHIMDMYRQAGGAHLLNRIMKEKRAEGTTLMTVVHHRETPLRIAEHSVDVGPVWATEITHARAIGLPIDAVEPGEKFDQRERINYYVCRLKAARNPENAEKFLVFISSSRAQAIYESHGFVSPPK